MEIVSFNESDMVRNMCIAKEHIISKLYKNGHITEELFYEYSEKWQVILIKTSLFERWKNKFLSKNEIDYTLRFVKFED